MQSPLLRALAAQVGGVLIATLFAAGNSMLTGSAPHPFAWIGVQALGAVAVARLLRMEWWWLVLHLSFGPAVAFAVSLPVAPHWSGLLLVVLLLAYGGTQQTRVPLYLSNRAAVEAFVGLVPRGREVAVLDLGCGTGTVLAALSRERPLVRLAGVERAPLPWLVAWIRGRLPGNRYHAAWGNLWDNDLSGYDVVYTYLSPAAMPRLWEKARREMRPGSLLVSFRFVIPGANPQGGIRVGNQWLYLWRM
jgi:methylase of polypeptide subunit release factors